jgi:hypothetical protein
MSEIEYLKYENKRLKRRISELEGACKNILAEITIFDSTQTESNGFILKILKEVGIE